MAGVSRDLRRRWKFSIDLVGHLVAREFRLRYRRALFGWLWALGEPLARLAVLTLVFTRFVHVGIPTDNYPAFVFTGLIAWSWFASGVVSATASAVDRRELLLRPGVPRAVVPVVSLLTDGLDLLAALPILALFLLRDDGIPWTAVMFPVLLGIQFLLAQGLGFLLCTANVYLRDVRLFVGLVMLVGFYATPVFYPPDQVPDRFNLLLTLNPMAQLLAMYRAVLLEGRLPAAVSVAALTAVCALVFVAGYAVYRRASPTFVDEL